LPDKRLKADIKFVAKRQTSPLLVAEELRIENSMELDVRMSLHFNPEVGSKTINVHIAGIGPICRLDVDGPRHAPCGRSHKHSLQTARCPDQNLPTGVLDRPDLSGKSMIEVFREFCAAAAITYDGEFEVPEEDEGDAP
jgi:hypothetical protein